MTLEQRLRDWLSMAEVGPERLSNEYELIYKAADRIAALEEALRGVVKRCEEYDSTGRFLGCRVCGHVYQGPRVHDADCPVLVARGLYENTANSPTPTERGGE